jgi:hypothetical protein
LPIALGCPFRGAQQAEQMRQAAPRRRHIRSIEQIAGMVSQSLERRVHGDGEPVLT